jgi:replicative DNA helicase
MNGTKQTKLPYQTNGTLAKSDDPTTWVSIDEARSAYEIGNFDGIGYVFHEGDPLCGIDLDGCRDPRTGIVADWAREAILKLDSYAEVSPSLTGVKVFVLGKNPFETGKKKLLTDMTAVSDKTPAIEIYDRTRYFAVTGWSLRGHKEPQQRQAELDWLKTTFWPTPPPPALNGHSFTSDASVLERARKYLTRVPPAVSGMGGHNATFYAACVLVIGFVLSEADALALLAEWNQTCDPPWTERELRHKVNQAMKQTGERGYLRDVPMQRWDRVAVPSFTTLAAAQSKAKITKLSDAAHAYVEAMRAGKTALLSTGIHDVDAAIGGGISAGEIIVVGARSGHGKSAAALQIVHQWTAEGRACLIISEEMSSLALGKRTLQFVSDVPKEHWDKSFDKLDDDVTAYAAGRAECLIVESCGTSAEAVSQMEIAVHENSVELVVVDYATLLRSPGGTTYEQATNTCKALVAAARRLNVTMVMLCQMNRSIESRSTFAPVMSDLRDSGQFEQDADVILFLIWPHRIDSSKPANEYKVYVAKNRNRETVLPVVKCRFDPSRQAIRPQHVIERARVMDNYTPAFESFNSEIGF